MNHQHRVDRIWPHCRLRLDFPHFCGIYEMRTAFWLKRVHWVEMHLTNECANRKSTVEHIGCCIVDVIPWYRPQFCMHIENWQIGLNSRKLKRFWLRSMIYLRIQRDFRHLHHVPWYWACSTSWWYSSSRTAIVALLLFFFTLSVLTIDKNHETQFKLRISKKKIDKI